MITITACVGITASVCGLLRAWPQAFRLVKCGDTSGVSATTWLLSLVTAVVWCTLGIGLDIFVTIVYNALGAIGPAAVLYLLVRHRQLVFWKPIATFLGSIMASAIVLLFFGQVGISVLGFTLSVITFLPQAIRIARNPASGVSAVTWALSAITSILWAIYGWAIDEFALIAPAFVMVPLALYILVRVTHTPTPELCLSVLPVPVETHTAQSVVERR